MMHTLRSHNNSSADYTIINPITHEFIQLLFQVGEQQCVAITAYFTLQMRAAAEVAEWEERN